MIKKTLIRNSAFGFVQFILTAIITLLSIPIFINKLGYELYAIFALVSVIGSLNHFMNFGLNEALLIYVAKQGKSRESDYDIAVTQIILIFLLTVFILIILIFKDFIINNLFSIPARYASQAKSLLIYYAVANSLILIGQTFIAVIDASQKIHLSNISQFIYSIIYWGGIITVVSFGGELASVGIMVFIASVIWLVIVFLIYRNLWGKLNLTGLKNQFSNVVHKQLSYGIKIYFAGLAGFLFEPLSKIILSNFIGLHAVAFFEIGTKLRNQINGILSKIFYPFYPFIAISKNDFELKSKVFDLSKKIQLIVIPILITVGFMLSILIKLWLGVENFLQISIFAITLTLTMLMFSPPILPIYQYLQAKNMADKTIWIQTSSVLVNIIIFFTLYNVIGLYSILVSNTLALFASFMVGNYYQIKYLGVKIRNEGLYYIKIFSFAILCTVACLIVRYFVSVGIWDLIIYPAIVITSFIFYVRLMKLISINDLESYFETTPSLKVTLKRILIS